MDVPAACVQARRHAVCPDIEMRFFRLFSIWSRRRWSSLLRGPRPAVDPPQPPRVPTKPVVLVIPPVDPDISIGEQEETAPMPFYTSPEFRDEKAGRR